MPYTTDEAAIATTFHAFYELLSGPAGFERDWEGLQSLFVPGAMIVIGPVSTDVKASAIILTVERYIERLKNGLGQRDFYEKGTISSIDVFGNIASVISTYEARHLLSDEHPFKRGVNYIHLLKSGDRWLVTSMIWRDESPDLPIK